ncbi:MAG: DUF5677 domain-containing protein [Actinomycetota bacterium]
MNQNQRDRALALMELVRSRLPAEFEVTGDCDAWPLISLALLSRTTGTLDSVLLLQPSERASDASTLVRSLYEHVVHFAWLAADPSAERIEEWRKHDLKQRLKADDDCKAVGYPLFDSATRAKIEAQVAAMKGNDLVLTNIAVAADKHWEPHIDTLEGHTQLRSFRGLYASAYRLHSGVAHPSERGIHPVVEDLTGSRRRVKLEDSFEGHGPYGLATAIYALALLVGEQSLGWPSTAEVDNIFAQHP